MVTETSPEVSTLPSADSSAPPSDDSLEVTPTTAEEEAPESQDGAEPEASTEFDPADLQTRLDAGELLTTPQKDALKAHNQAQADQARAQAQARQANAETRQRTVALNEQFEQRLHDAVTREVEAAETEERAISPTLLRASVKAEKDAYLGAVSPLVLHSWDAYVKTGIYDVHPDKAEAQKALDALDSQPFDFTKTLLSWGAASYLAGQQASPDAKKVKTLETQNAKLKADLEKATGARGKGNSPSGDGREGTGGGVPTFAQLQTMKKAQLDALPDAVFEKAMSGG